MNVEEIRNICIAKKASEESFPFDKETLVFKVMGKMFALMSLNKTGSINLKCDPDKSIELRERYAEVIPGFHMNKKHWNTVNYIETLPNTLVVELINHSYDLVVSSLTKKQKQQLNLEE